MKKNLITRLDKGPVIFAEGYLFAMERRGYLSAGPFVPEVVLEHPDVVTQFTVPSWRTYVKSAF